MLIDSNFHPWIMEINLSPSIATEAPLDFKIKSSLLTDTFNMVGVKPFDRKIECEKKIKSRTRAGLNHLTKGAQFSKLPNPLQAMRAPIAILGSGFITKQDIENCKHKEQKVTVHQDVKQAIKELSNIDSSITQADQELMIKLASYKKREIIKETLSEYERRGNFDRIFPAQGTDKYHKFFMIENHMNQFVYDFIYGGSNVNEESKAEVELEPKDPYASINGFFQSQKNSYMNSKNEHFIDLESKLRPLRQRPDSAINTLRYKGLSTTNDSNISTSSTYYNKNNDSLVGGISSLATQSNIQNGNS